MTARLFKAAFTGLRDLNRDLGRWNERIGKAARAAVRVEGFRLSRTLKAEIREGAPGGRRFSPLTEIAKRAKAGFIRGERDIRLHGGANVDRAPLRRLAAAAGYDARKIGGRFRLSIGFVRRGLSRSWTRIAALHQQGETIPVTEELRRGLIRTGARLKRKGRTLGRAGGRSGAWSASSDGAYRFFFLRKSTRRFKVPARPVIDPFWERHGREVLQNIERNFRRKLRGERI